MILLWLTDRNIAFHEGKKDNHVRNWATFIKCQHLTLAETIGQFEPMILIKDSGMRFLQRTSLDSREEKNKNVNTCAMFLGFFFWESSPGRRKVNATGDSWRSGHWSFVHAHFRTRAQLHPFLTHMRILCKEKNRWKSILAPIIFQWRPSMAIKSLNQSLSTYTLNALTWLGRTYDQAQFWYVCRTKHKKWNA